MRQSWKIFTNDIHNISRNWVAMILIGGLVFLPSLYAWFNIYASWDPYGKTDSMPIGIVNEDQGATVNGESMNVGDQLVDTLKNNDSFEWHFTNRQNAMDKVEYGDYFAVLIIPENFSEKLRSVVSEQPEKAQIDYYVNEKINSIAPKITDKGASLIVEKVNSHFIGTVNGVIFDLFNELGIEIENNLSDIQLFENYVFDIQEKLPEVHNLLKGTLGDAHSASQIVQRARSLMPAAEQTVSEGLQTINDATTLLNQAEKRLAEVKPGIQEDLNKASAVAKEANSFLQKLQSIQLDFTQMDAAKKKLDEHVSASIEKTASISDDLQWLQSFIPPASDEEDHGANERIQHAIDSVNQLQSFLQEAQTNARTIDEAVTGKQEELRAAVNDLQGIAANTSVRIDEFITLYNEVIEPTVRRETANAKATLGQAKSILSEIQTVLPGVTTTLNSTGGHLDEGETLLRDMLGEYPFISSRVNELADRIREIQGETDIKEIIDLLQNDPQAEKSFFEEPIMLNETKLFPIKNYGTGMSPFYTVLSIWVGCLLLISLLSTDAKPEVPVKSWQLYVGRLLTFGLLSLMQTSIIILGDLFILGVTPHNPVWFFLFGLFISLLFMSIVYTLVSLFGDVGKAVAIVLLVLQLAGSGGTYPVQLLPDLFQWINPFLPFTYAIDLMREAIGGIVWARALRDVFVLVPFIIVFLVIGLLFKRKVNQFTYKLLDKSRDSGLFH